ncbi:unnamed protein product [Adineta ricciae]|uniref:beta-galactosidase n=1 Tax=Adineta ricciae TaxID=249248 RepID=A0A816CSK4_ADIRI|nr:unnamed protein product [Adineta ricciae]CAF1629118.1 unnamed protein product [Adineta ricciae]
MRLIVLTSILICIAANPITYDDVRGVPYKVSYDHRAITINDVRTMLISGAIHYPRSTPAMWPYIMQMAKNQGLNTIQTYVFWNLHQPRRGVWDFTGRANLSGFLQEAANAGLFVNLRIGPYISGEWTNGGIPVWLNQVPNISFRTDNAAWKTVMRQFILNIIDYISSYLAKNGGPIIIAQIENELMDGQDAYASWCGDLVSNELSFTEIPWIMCNGLSAKSTIETCNSCNCLDDGWIARHLQASPDKPMMFTENEGWFQIWGQPISLRRTSDLAYSVAEWYAAGGSYHAYYMWFGGNNYGRFAASGVSTLYADDVCLHADGTPNEPKFTQLSRLQHIVANYSKIMLSQDPVRTAIPYWDGYKWLNGTSQFVYSYSNSIYFIISQATTTLYVLFRNQTILMAQHSVRIYDGDMDLLWNSASYSDISSGNTQIIPVVTGPLNWQIWSESLIKPSPPLIISPNPLEQLNITNDETVYMWYRRNVTLKQPSSNSIVRVQTNVANALLFFMDGEYLGEFDDHTHSQGAAEGYVVLDLSRFHSNQQYLFEILSISFGLFSGVYPNTFQYKGIDGNIWLDDDLLVDNKTETNFWSHQKGLLGEYLGIYTENGSSKVNWDSQWTKGINKPITWFQARFDLNNLSQQDMNANPILLDAQGLNRGHVYINGNDIGLYWLIQGICENNQPCCCQHAQTNCLKPTQRFYHIPPDWLKRENNLITIFEDSGAPSPGSVGLVQRIVTNS